MRDVAALAGVSIKTVSRVVNQEAGVSADLAARVQDAIRSLDYHHNTTASTLRRANQRTATIGLVLHDVGNPFSSALHRAIEDVARGHRTLVFAVSSDLDAAREDQHLRALISRRVDGIIAVPSSDGNLSKLLRLDRPTVFVDRPGLGLAADSVVSDNRSGAMAAVRHLAAHGHRRIAFLGDLHSIWTANERYLGYVEGLATEGLRLDKQLVRQDVSSSALAEQAVHELLAHAQPPSALFTGQNLITIGAIRALQRLGLQQQIALVGFDDIVLADLLAPPVSVIAQNPPQIGKTAAELLFSRLEGDTRPPQQIVVPTRLIARGSGEIAPRASLV
jgi:LacI family transcriptional regulator